MSSKSNWHCIKCTSIEPFRRRTVHFNSLCVTTWCVKVHLLNWSAVYTVFLQGMSLRFRIVNLLWARSLLYELSNWFTSSTFDFGSTSKADVNRISRNTFSVRHFFQIGKPRRYLFYLSSTRFSLAVPNNHLHKYANFVVYIHSLSFLLTNLFNLTDLRIAISIRYYQLFQLLLDVLSVCFALWSGVCRGFGVRLEWNRAHDGVTLLQEQRKKW